VTAKGHPRLRFAHNGVAELSSGSGTRKLEFTATEKLADASTPKLELNDGALLACEAGAVLRLADITVP